MSRSPDRIPRDRLFAYLREYETDNGFIPREHDISRSLMYDFAKDRHIPAKPQPPEMRRSSSPSRTSTI